MTKKPWFSEFDSWSCLWIQKIQLGSDNSISIKSLKEFNSRVWQEDTVDDELRKKRQEK